MELAKITFKRESFDLIPKGERIFLVQLSLFANEITMLHKLIVFSNNYKDGKTVLTAQNVQSFFLIKLLAGKLYEGWQMLQKSYFKRSLSKQYEKILSKKGRDSIGHIKSYFGKRNLISLIRNKYAFHYDYEHINKELASIPADEDLELYLAPDHGNSLYSMAHIISSYALFDEVDSSDDFKALDKIFKDVLGVASKFLVFAGELSGKIWQTYRIPVSVGKVHIRRVPTINSVRLPYFI